MGVSTRCASGAVCVCAIRSAALPLPACVQGFHKILKKHDKLVPHAPCRQFYIAHLHQQPWVQVRWWECLLVGTS